MEKFVHVRLCGFVCANSKRSLLEIDLSCSSKIIRFFFDQCYVLIRSICLYLVGTFIFLHFSKFLFNRNYFLQVDLGAHFILRAMHVTKTLESLAHYDTHGLRHLACVPYMANVICICLTNLGSCWPVLPRPYRGMTLSRLMPALHTGHTCLFGLVSNHCEERRLSGGKAFLD